MPYSPQTWANGPTGGTPLSAARLTTLETGVAAAHIASACRVYANATGQTIPSGNLDRIDVNTTEHNDSTSVFTIDLATDTVTVALTGLYLVSWHVRFTGGSSGSRFGLILINATTTVHEFGFVGTFGTAAGAIPVRLTAGNGVSLYGFVDGGTAVTVVGTAVFHTGFSVTYMGS